MIGLKIATGVAVIPAFTLLVRGTAWLVDAPWSGDTAWATICVSTLVAYGALMAMFLPR